MDLTSDDKLRATTISHPNAAAVVAPGAIERARGFAQLACQTHAGARVGAATVRVAVIGFARDVVFATITIVTVSAAAMMSAEDEFGAASIIDPNTAVVVSPRAAFDAAALAELTRELHAEMRVGGAPVTMAVLRFADDRFVALRENGRGDENDRQHENQILFHNSHLLHIAYAWRNVGFSTSARLTSK